MADKKFDLLKAKVEKKSSLNNEVSFKLSDDEMSILERKADAIGMGISELVREYIVDTALFDNSPFEEKKAKARTNKKQIKDELENK